MTQSVMVTLENRVIPPGHPSKFGAQRENRSSYHLPNGSEIALGGLDHPDRFMSSEYDMIVVGEATELTLEDWEKLISRLRHGVMPWQQIIGDCNPSYPSHWLYARTVAGKCLLFVSRHEDNPMLWQAGKWTAAGEQYRSTLSALSGVRRKRLLEGLWAAADGLVYPEFAGIVRAASGSLSSPAVRVAGAIDWGWTDPTAVLVGAESQDGILRIVEEIYEPHLPFDELARRMSEMAARWRVETWYADPSRADLIDQLRRLGLPVYPNHVRQIETGIAMVGQRIRRQRLLVWDCCASLVRESTEYEYGKDRAGNTKTTPLDQHNHAMDALRYLVCGLDYGLDMNVSPDPVAAQRTAQAKSDEIEARKKEEKEAAERLALADPESQKAEIADEERRKADFARAWGDEGWE